MLDRPGDHAGILRRRKLFTRREGGTRESRRNLRSHRSRGRRPRRSRHVDSESGASPGRATIRRQGLPAASGGDDYPRADAGEGMQGWTLRSVPRQLCEAITFRRQAQCRGASRSVAATVSKDPRHAGDTRGGNTYMGDPVAGVATRARTSEVDFALIGHQESWRAAADVLAVLRGPERTPLPDDEIRDILPWLPPRAVCHVDIESVGGATARGLYIDSFIVPDRLADAYVRDNIARVRGAAAYAIKAGAKIVSLGGFSSILIEGNFDQLPQRHHTVFTTGNTLTVGFIVQGIRKMCAVEGRDLRRSTLLIVGATGDLGSGCARCLAGEVRRVQLTARNVERLRRLAAELEAEGVEVEMATDLRQFSSEADVV